MPENSDYFIIIPAQVRTDKRLVFLDKLIFGEIFTLAQKDGFCWASNRYFSDIYDVQPETVSRSIKKMGNLGYISICFEGAGHSSRRIVPLVSPFDSEVNPLDLYVKGLDAEVKAPLICTSKTLDVEVKQNIRGIINKTDYSGLFDSFWSAYPRKVAKQSALKAFKKLNPDEALLADMLAALDWQRTSDDWQRDGGKFIPYPATWLNGHRWEDDPPNKPEEPARPAVMCETYLDESGRRCARFVSAT